MSSNEVKLKQELQIIAEKLADIEAEMEEYKYAHYISIILKLK